MVHLCLLRQGHELVISGLPSQQKVQVLVRMSLYIKGTNIYQNYQWTAMYHSTLNPDMICRFLYKKQSFELER